MISVHPLRCGRAFGAADIPAVSDDGPDDDLDRLRREAKAAAVPAPGEPEVSRPCRPGPYSAQPVQGG